MHLVNIICSVKPSDVFFHAALVCLLSKLCITRIDLSVGIYYIHDQNEITNRVLPGYVQ